MIRCPHATNEVDLMYWLLPKDIAGTAFVWREE